MSALKPPAANPCGSCPYRRDVPSGIWAHEEYAKLPNYDAPTAQQPTHIFLCHQQNQRVCAGWCGTHDMDNSLAVRFASIREPRSVIEAILDYKTSTPLFSSGAEAYRHGMRFIDSPPAKTRIAIDSLIKKRKLKGKKEKRMHTVKRTDAEIDEQLNRASNWENEGTTQVPGMTYEQGVQAGIRWILGDSDDIPVENDIEDEDEE